MARLSHPISWRFTNSGRHGLYFFVMEYVDGLSLRQLLNAGHVSPKRRWPSCRRFATPSVRPRPGDRASRHQAGEHPSQRQGQVKIADFGLAKLVGTGPRGGGEKFMGTPQYMAPEQSSRRGVVDHRRTSIRWAWCSIRCSPGSCPRGSLDRRAEGAHRRAAGRGCPPAGEGTRPAYQQVSELEDAGGDDCSGTRIVQTRPETSRSFSIHRRGGVRASSASPLPRNPPGWLPTCRHQVSSGSCHTLQAFSVYFFRQFRHWRGVYGFFRADRCRLSDGIDPSSRQPRLASELSPIITGAITATTSSLLLASGDRRSSVDTLGIHLFARNVLANADRSLRPPELLRPAPRRFRSFG